LLVMWVSIIWFSGNQRVAPEYISKMHRIQFKSGQSQDKQRVEGGVKSFLWSRP